MSRHPFLLNFGELNIFHYIVQLQITGSVTIDMLYGIPSHFPFSFVENEKNVCTVLFYVQYFSFVTQGLQVFGFHFCCIYSPLYFFFFFVQFNI